MLAHYDPNKPILLQCDASNYGLGAVLSHIMEGGTERPVGLESRTFNAAEINYSQLDKEGAAIMFALNTFHKQIYGRCFVIMTDHKPLVSLFGELKHVPVTSPRVQQKWAITVRGYEYKIHYQAGRSRGNADCLGWLPLPVTVKEEPDERVLLIEELDSSPISAAQICHCTDRDPMQAHVREYLMRGWPDGKIDINMAPYHCGRDELGVQDGCVL